MCDGDHSRLGGGDTSSAWDLIRAEYEQLTGGVGYSRMIGLLREINYLSAKLQVVDAVTDLMKKYYQPELGNILASYDLKYNWIDITEEIYYKQLTSVVSRSKTWYVQLLAKKKEWDSLNTTQSDKAIDREYFEEWLITLSKDQGYGLKSTDISTYRFAIMVKRLLEEVKQQK